MTEQNKNTATKAVEEVAIDGETPAERITGPARWVVITGDRKSVV